MSTPMRESPDAEDNVVRYVTEAAANDDEQAVRALVRGVYISGLRAGQELMFAQAMSVRDN